MNYCGAQVRGELARCNERDPISCEHPHRIVPGGVGSSLLGKAHFPTFYSVESAPKKLYARARLGWPESSSRHVPINS
jgi:hypothetical protein